MILKKILFFNDLTSQKVKILFLGFCLLFFVIICCSFVLQKLKFFEYFIISDFSFIVLASSFNLLSVLFMFRTSNNNFLCTFLLFKEIQLGLKYFTSSFIISGIFY
jgi:hypothetical protein